MARSPRKKKTPTRPQLWWEVDIWAEPESVSIEGNAMVSGDDQADREAEQWVYAQLAAGNEGAWCQVICRAQVELLFDPGYLFTVADEFDSIGTVSVEGGFRDAIEYANSTYELEKNAMAAAWETTLQIAYKNGSPVSPSLARHRKKLQIAIADWCAAHPNDAVMVDAWLEKL